MKERKKVYIISRYRASSPREVDFNKRVARHAARCLIREGKQPVAPHLFYTQFLDDDFELEREAGLKMGIADLRGCDEFLLVVIDGVVSEGMRQEIVEISRLGMPGRIISVSKQEIKEAMKVVV